MFRTIFKVNPLTSTTVASDVEKRNVFAILTVLGSNLWGYFIYLSLVDRVKEAQVIRDIRKEIFDLRRGCYNNPEITYNKISTQLDEIHKTLSKIYESHRNDDIVNDRNESDFLRESLEDFEETSIFFKITLENNIPLHHPV